MKDNSAQLVVVPKSHSDVDFDITTINANSASFDFLKDQADIYSPNDVIKHYS
jgi:hypothetical protein